MSNLLKVYEALNIWGYLLIIKLHFDFGEILGENLYNFLRFPNRERIKFNKRKIFWVMLIGDIIL